MVPFLFPLLVLDACLEIIVVLSKFFTEAGNEGSIDSSITSSHSKLNK